MLRGHLPVFHDLLDLGSFVLKPDFHLGGGTKVHVIGTLRGHPCLPQGGDWRLLGPPRRPGPGVSPQFEAYRLGAGPEAKLGLLAREGVQAESARLGHGKGTTRRLSSFVWAVGRGQARVSAAACKHK